MWETFLAITAICGFLGINVLQGGNLTYRLVHWRRSRRLQREIDNPHRPMRRNVVGRDGAVADLRKLLCSGGTGVITPVPTVTGGAGIGKTTLARHYAAMHQADYARTEFIRSETEDNIMRDLAGLADRITQESPQIPLKTRAQHGLELITQGAAQANWLVIFDNVPNPEAIAPWLPQGQSLHVLLTTRHPDWKGTYKPMKAGVLAPDDAIALLAQEAERDDPGFAKLADVVGHLPLALIQAGEWLREHPEKSADDYLAKLERLIDTRTEDPNREYEKSTGAVVRLTLQDLSKDARALAAILCWFSPDDIDATAFEELAKKPWPARYFGVGRAVPARVWSIARNPIRRRAGFAELRLKAMLEDGEDGKLRMHRTTQMVLRNALGRKAKPDAAAALLAAVYPNKASASSNWPTCRRLTPHIRAIWASGKPESLAMKYLLNQAGIFFSVTGDHENEIVFGHAKVALDEALLPEDHRDIAVGRANLGVALAETGNFEEAEVELHRSVELNEKHRPGSFELAESHSMLGSVLLAKGQAGDASALRKSLRSYQRAAVIYRRLFPRLHDARAKVLYQIGTVRDAMGRSSAGLRLCGYCLAIEEKLFSPDDTRLAQSYQMIGAMALEAGQADRAEGLLEQAMEIWRGALLPEEIPRVRDARNAAAWLIFTYLTRARAGENKGVREAKAKALCAEFGFDYDQRVEEAKRYPYNPAARTGRDTEATQT